MGDILLRKILIVDEQGLLNSNIIKEISSEYQIKYCEDIETATKSVESYKIKSVVLTHSDDSDFDQLLSVIRQINQDKTIAVYVLSENKRDDFQIEAFKAGAADWIYVDFSPSLIKYRISKTILKDTPIETGIKSKSVRFKNLIIDFERYEIILDGIRITLPRKEFEILSLLSSKPGVVFRRADIINNVWIKTEMVRNRTIDVHMRMLREKIGSSYIKTIKGVGYKFIISH